MLPKTFSLVSLLCLVATFSFAHPTADSNEDVLNSVRPSLHFDFDACVSFAGGHSADYSEFTPIVESNPECSSLEILGDHLYRALPNRNGHSCAPGLNGTRAMCISGNDNCTYFPGDDNAILIDIMVGPGTAGAGSLDNISFSSRAPRTFQFINGESGLNDYPTKFRVRVLSSNGEVYRSDEITTSDAWTQRRFDIGDIDARVTEPTLFRIEILPYCLVGNGGKVQAWDIEDLVITGGCAGLDGGRISTNSDTRLCSTNSQMTVVADVINNVGDVFRWVVVDENNRIVALPSNNNINFNQLSGSFTIYNLSYVDVLNGLSIGADVFSLQGCYDLSNGISVNSSIVRGGNLNTAQGGLVTLCPNMADNNVEFILTGNEGPVTDYVVSNSQGTILGVFRNNNVDFSSFAEGRYTVYAISHDGNINGLVNGRSISDLSGCFEFSSAASVDRLSTAIVGGQISINGRTSLTFCQNLTEVSVDLSGNVGTNSTYIIVNSQNKILSMQTGPSVRFSNLTETNFSILHLSYEGSLTGLALNNFLSDVRGCFDVSNPINLTREQALGGTITTNGNMSVSLCLKNNDSQAVEIDLVGADGDRSVFLVTDEQGNILELPQLSSTGSIDFDAANPGVCLIWHLSYNGSISGLTRGSNAADLAGECFDLSNSIRVNRLGVESGQINGPMSYDICLNDPAESNISLTVSGAAGRFTSWIVTDDMGNVLEISDNGDFDLSNAPSGQCFIYHIAHSDEEILFGTDQRIDDIVLGCFELSEPVSINRNAVETGSLAFSDGTTRDTIRAILGGQQQVELDLNGMTGVNSDYVVTDTSGVIISIQQSSTFTFTIDSDDICNIYHVASAGTVTGLQVGENFSDLGGCLDTSNPVVIIKEVEEDPVAPAVISLLTGETDTTICVGDNFPDTMSAVVVTAPQGAFGSFLVTDDQGEILEVQGTNNFNFADAPSGICRIYHVVYSQMPLAGLSVGNNINSFTGNFALSNSLVINRDRVAGGVLLSNTTTNNVTIIVGDNIPDTIGINYNGIMGDSSIFLITTRQGLILDIQDEPIVIEETNTDSCFLWNLSFAFGLDGLATENLVGDLDGCFALSNPLLIVKEEFIEPDSLDGGRILTVSGDTTTTICLNSNETTVDVNLTGNAGENSQYVITDDNGVILGLPGASPFNFMGTQPGNCQLWHLSYDGMIMGLTMGENVSGLQGDFDFSNPIIVERVSVDGGELETTGGATTVNIVVQDSAPDTIRLDLTDAAGDSTVILITDEAGKILELNGGPDYIFEDQPAGTCQIWNISFLTGLTGLEVDNNVSQIAGCFELSNPVTVVRTVTPTQDSLVVFRFRNVAVEELDTICIPLLVSNFDSIDTYGGSVAWDSTMFTFYEVQDFGVPGLGAGDFNLSAAGALAYSWIDDTASNPATLMDGDTLFSVCLIAVGDECDVSSISVVNSPTAISVTMSGATPSDPSIPLNADIEAGEVTITDTPGEACLDPGVIELADGTTSDILCVGDGNEDTLTVVFVQDTIGLVQEYIVTDAAGNILEIQQGNEFLFDEVDGGTCYIYSIVYDQVRPTGLVDGQNVTGIAGHFELSNRITVIRNEVDGGILSTTSGQDTIRITVGDNVPDTIVLSLADAAGDNLQYLLTDAQGNILEFVSDTVILDGTQAGVCNLINLAYNGQLDSLEVGTLRQTLRGCLDFSNIIRIEKEVDQQGGLQPGIASFAGGGTTLDLCVGEDGGTAEYEVTGAMGASMIWVLSDTTGTILATRMQDFVTFINADPGVCEINHIVYDGLLTGLVFGEDLDTLGGNYMLSNTLTLNKIDPSPDNITFEDGTTLADVVTADGNIDTLNIVAGLYSTDTTLFIMTNTQDEILAIQDSTSFLFENQNSGICFIYQVTFDFGFNGIQVGASLDTISGCFGLSNSVAVNKSSNFQNNGGIITTVNGVDLKYCLTDATSDTVFVDLTSANGQNTDWVITDTFGIISYLPAGPPFILDTLPAGTCQIWHVSYQDQLTGLTIGAHKDSLMGMWDYSNSILVDRNEAQSGMLTTLNGMTTDSIFLGNLPADSLRVSLTGTILGDTSTWVVTDTFGNIILLPDNPPFVLDALDPGICRVWHMAHEFNLDGLQIGNTIPNDISGCYDLSNSLEVIKVQTTSSLANGGTISTLDGTNEFCACDGDDGSDMVSILLNGQSGSNFSFVVTATDGLILQSLDTTQLLLDTAIVDIEVTNPQDTFLLYHVAYDIPGVALEIPNNINNLVGVYGFSNPITIVKKEVDAPSIFAVPDTTIIAGDGIIDSLDFNLIGAENGDSLIYIVYDTTGVILEIHDDTPLTFEQYGDNTLNVSLMAFMDGTEGIEIDSNIMNISGCFQISAPETVNTQLPDFAGGNLMTSDNMLTAEFCFNSTNALDSVDVILTGSIGDEFSWIVTDTSGTILDLPAGPPFIFNDTDPDTSFVWSISYDSTLVGLVIGEDVDTLSGSFALSNSILVTTSKVVGGSISTPSMLDTLDFCVGDGLPDVGNFVSSGTTGTSQFVVLDTNGVILAVLNPGMGFLDFEGFGDGECRVHNMSSVGEVLGLAPTSNIDDLIGCFEFSTDYITVNKFGIDANIIQSDPLSLDNFISFCVSDGQPDSLTLSTNSTMGDYVYIISDTLNIIDSILVGNVIDFEGSDFGNCRIYGVSYTGNLVAMPGDSIGGDNLSDQCFEFTGLPIEVEKADCSMPRINEISADQKVEIINDGTGPVDLSNFYLCGAGFTYARIGDMPIDCGDLMLDPGELVVIEINSATGASININAADDELALYRNNLGFGLSVNMVHYVEWGSTGHDRSNLAVIAGLWLTGQSAPAITTGMSLKRNSNSSGMMALDWSVGMPTPCATNIADDPVLGKAVEYDIYPNPASEIMTIDVESMPEDEGRLEIYDSFGAIIDRVDVNIAKEVKVDLGKYGPGVYYTKLISGHSGKTQRLIIVK